MFSSAGLGCSSRGPAPPTISAGRLADNAETRELVRSAILLDHQRIRADSLYLPGATVIANGRERLGVPRFAALGPGGRVSVRGISLEVTETTGWAVASYVWTSTDGRSFEGGRATFLLLRTEDGWRIRHVHSSQVLPWESK